MRDVTATVDSTPKAAARDAKRLLPWLLASVAFALVLVQTIFPPEEGTFIEGELLAGALAVYFVFVNGLFAFLAALILSRQPGNRVAWLLMAVAFMSTEPQRYLIPSSAPDALTPGLWLVLWVDNWLWFSMLFVIILIPLHFPDGRPPAPRWRWVNRIALVLLLFNGFITMIGSEIGPGNGPWRVANPIGLLQIEGSEEPAPVALSAIFFLLFFSMAGGSIASLFLRFRRGGAIVRQQIKWLFFGGALFVLSFGVIVGTYFIVGEESQATWAVVPFYVAIGIIPVAIANAILRFRLWEIDLIIRRTLIYAVLTGLLAATYFGMVVTLQTLFGSLTGERSPVLIVVSTLVIAALFAPLRRRVQAVINRRFFRQRYDAEQILARFAGKARDEVELDSLTSEIVGIVEETMRPERVTLWLRSASPE